MTQFAEEMYDEVIDEIAPLFEQHWEEIALNKDKIKLSPDLSKYKALNDLGILRIFTARNEGLLVGYFVVIAQPHLHYQEHTFAMNDIIYIHPDYRGSTVAYRMIKYVEKVLKKDGVSVLMINMKVFAPFDNLLEKLQFTNTERVHSKYIGD